MIRCSNKWNERQKSHGDNSDKCDQWRHTEKDFQLLQQTRDTGSWENWLIYMLKAVSYTAKHITILVEKISLLLAQQKQVIRRNYKFYSQDLMNNLFSF